VAEPTARLLFQHGQITAHDAQLIAKSVMFYGAAVWAFSLQQILSRAYYALHDTVTPVVMSAITLAVNLAVELPLVWTPLGEAGMAAGTLVSFSLQALVMLWLLDRKTKGLGLGEMAPRLLKMLLATAIMTAACVGVQHLPFYPHGHARLALFGQLGLVIGAGAVVYLLACRVLGINLADELLPRRRRAG